MEFEFICLSLGQYVGVSVLILDLSYRFLEGGTLLDYVKAAGHLKEEKIANFLFQMLNSINVCHMKGIAHRDLKFEVCVEFVKILRLCLII